MSCEMSLVILMRLTLHLRNMGGRVVHQSVRTVGLWIEGAGNLR